MRPWLLVPARSLADGKSRLAGILRESARHALNERLLRRMLSTAARYPGGERTAVVSDCDEVLRLSAKNGVRCIRQTTGAGLNAAVQQGIEELRALGAQDIIVIACDEPLVRPADIRELAQLGERCGGAVICPDRHGQGTNALLVPGGSELRYQFGAGSFARHRDEVLRAGLAAQVHLNERIAFDIDTPEDLAIWLRGSAEAARATHRRLRCTAAPATAG